MKRLFLTVLAAILSFVSLQAGKIATDSLYSHTLGSFRKFYVYLPDGYDRADRYPVVYLLHGLYGSYPDWKDSGRMKPVADELIESGEICKMVIVMPDAGGFDMKDGERDYDVHKYQNGYFNVKGWNYEDFFFSEFIPSVEEKYSCGGSKGMRSIMGLSMGGGGCTVYCQRHPDFFSSCYAMSAWLDNEDPSYGKAAVDTLDKLFLVRQSVNRLSALKFVETADEAAIEAMRTVKWYFDCGDDDSMLRETVEIHFKMSEAGIKNELIVRNGTHSWEYWHTALRIALPFASRNFTRP